MERHSRTMNSVISVKTHYELPKVTETELQANSGQILKDADQGIQTAVVGEDGQTVQAVIGLNGARYLPDPDPDPMDELMKFALDTARKEKK